MISQSDSLRWSRLTHNTNRYGVMAMRLIHATSWLTASVSINCMRRVSRSHFKLCSLSGLSNAEPDRIDSIDNSSTKAPLINTKREISLKIRQASATTCAVTTPAAMMREGSHLTCSGLNPIKNHPYHTLQSLIFRFATLHEPDKEIGIFTGQ